MAGCGWRDRGGVAATLGCAVALGAGCGGGGSVPQARGRAQRTALARRYLVIAEAGNRRLEADLDPLEERDRSHLARATADLRDAAAAERLFDRRLLGIAFPPRIERVARMLYTVNEARATLTTAAAASATVGRLHVYEQRLTAANVPVERAVTTIRRQLGLPPPSTS